VAFAGGVNLILTPDVSLSMSSGGFLAPDARCKAFGAAADGIGRAEGAGLVLLKPLAKAQADGDRIYAVIRGSAMNQDGRSNGLTAPSCDAQEELLRAALADAALDADAVAYVEAHGTGTPLGDQIEAAALGAVYGKGRSVDRP